MGTLALIAACISPARLTTQPMAEPVIYPPVPQQMLTATPTSFQKTKQPINKSLCKPQEYNMQPNDTIKSVASKFEVTVEEIEAINQLKNSTRVSAHQILTIPCRSGAKVYGTQGQSVQDDHSLPTASQRFSTTPVLNKTITPTATTNAESNKADDSVTSTPDPTNHPVSTVDVEVPILIQTPIIIGRSTGDFPINAYQFGDGPTHLVFIGGIHGGYEWNTILLAYKAIDYFTETPEAIPQSLSLFIIPSANPDGQWLVTDTADRFTPNQVAAETRPGRFNNNQVDLNRNWDCHWSKTGLWGIQEVSGGSEPFSEVETQVLRDFLTNQSIKGVIFWHSALESIFAGGCNERFPAAEKLGQVYAEASGYPFKQSFSSYAVTGDATDWLSLRDIPAITVELTDHTNLDWDRNLKGMSAVLNSYDEPKQ